MTDGDEALERQRAIIMVVRFADGTRRVRACTTAEEARAFAAGETEYWRTHPYNVSLGSGTLERREDCFYTTHDELVAALKLALR